MFTRPDYAMRYVTAAVRAFVRLGFGGTTMRDIAEEAGLSQPRVSQVFGSKLAAFLAAHTHVHNLLAADLGATASEPSRTGGMNAAADVISRLAVERPEVWQMVLQTAAAVGNDPAIGLAHRRSISQLTALLMEVWDATPAQAADFVHVQYFHRAITSS